MRQVIDGVQMVNKVVLLERKELKMHILTQPQIKQDHQFVGNRANSNQIKGPSKYVTSLKRKHKLCLKKVQEKRGQSKTEGSNVKPHNRR